MVHLLDAMERKPLDRSQGPSAEPRIRKSVLAELLTALAAPEARAHDNAEAGARVPSVHAWWTRAIARVIAETRREVSGSADTGDVALQPSGTD
jgi:hypothetical protein